MRIRSLVGSPCVMVLSLVLAACGTNVTNTSNHEGSIVPSPSPTAGTSQSAAIDRYVKALAAVERHDRNALACFGSAELERFLDETKAAAIDLKAAFDIEPKKASSRQWRLADYYAMCVSYTTKCLSGVYRALRTGDTAVGRQWARAAAPSERRAAKALKAYIAYVKQA